MAKPNFKFQKRQKELDRKKKQDEKMQRKLERETSPLEDDSDQLPTPKENALSSASEGTPPTATSH